MKLYNTLSHQIQDFKPIEDKNVRLYTCGPTVYNFAHIGNLRTYIFEDILRRSLEFFGYQVRQVMNMTDIDDKTIAAAKGDKEELSALTQKYEKTFLADLQALNIESPTEITRATEYIPQIVEFISDLLERGFAYKAKDGSIYFSIKKFSAYGKLSGLDHREVKSGARVSGDEYTKENPADFVLWKAWDKDDGDIYWSTKLGKGRPGWHIECSTMSQDRLGETIDIHAGGVDLIFPHHENEIAQSEARSGKKFVNFWLHGEHLLVDGKKMSKSLGNIYYIKDLQKRGFSPLDFRYLCLSAHYRDKLNFTWESLKAAKNARIRAKNILFAIHNAGSIDQKYISKFKLAVENDLNLPAALAVFWNLLRDEKISAENKKATALEMDKILALDLQKSDQFEIPTKIQKLIDARKSARKDKNFELADKLRTQIENFGFLLEDFGEETKVIKISSRK